MVAITHSLNRKTERKRERKKEKRRKEGDIHQRKLVITTYVFESRKHWRQTRKQPKR